MVIAEYGDRRIRNAQNAFCAFVILRLPGSAQPKFCENYFIFSANCFSRGGKNFAMILMRKQLTSFFFSDHSTANVSRKREEIGL